MSRRVSFSLMPDRFTPKLEISRKTMLFFLNLNKNNFHLTGEKIDKISRAHFEGKISGENKFQHLTPANAYFSRELFMQKSHKTGAKARLMVIFFYVK
jgi:hypothetical protein